MSLKVIVNVDNPADLLAADAYDAGALLRLERADDEGGPFVEIDTLPLVSTTTQYEFWDLTGTSADFYRSRVSDDDNTRQSEYSDVTGSEPVAYASLDAVRETMNAPTDAPNNLLSDLLVDVSDDITELLGRDFYRHPFSGTETRTYHVRHRGERLLSRALGQELDIVSAGTVELADTVGGDYTEIVAGSTGYYLLPEYPRDGHPFDDLELSFEGATHRVFPAGGLVRFTDAVFGWSSVPGLVRRATIDLVRESYRQGPGGGGPIGVSALGQPIFGPGTPPTVIRAYKRYRRQSFAHV